MTKVLALFSIISLSLLIQTLVAYLMILLVVNNTVDWNHLFEMHLNGYVLCLFFGAIGVVISQTLKGIKNYMGPVVGVVMGTYFLHGIGSAVDDANWIAKFSPFHYLGVDEFNPLAIIVFTLAILLITLAALRIFDRKDIGA